MKKEIADKWVAALRSGEYEQTQAVLANRERTKHCCLGVLCELAIEDGVEMEVDAALGSTYFDGWASTLPVSVMHWAGVVTNVGEFNDGSEHLASANDVGATFDILADTIERRWEEL